MDPSHIKKAISEEYEKAKEEIFQDGKERLIDEIVEILRV